MKKGLVRGLALSLTACLLFALLSVGALAVQPDSAEIIWLPDGYQEYMGGIYGFDDGRLRVTQYIDGKYLHGYVDENMELVIPCIYELTECFSEGVACVKKDGAVYFIDTAGNKVFDTPIRSGAAILPRFVNGYAMLYGTPGGTAVMDRTGKVRFYVKEGDSIGNTVFNDRVWFRSGYYYGYLDTYGNIVVPAEYDYASDFYDGYACVRKGTTLSFIDTMGNVVGTLPFPVKEGTRAYSYVSCWGSQDGVFIIDTYLETDVKYSSKILVSKNGEVLLPGFYSDIKSGYGSGIFTVYDRSDNHSGMYYVRSNGTFINPKSYLKLEPFKEDLARVSVSKGLNILKNWGFIDMDGNEIVPTIYQDADDFSEGLAGVKQDGKWGFVDKTGQVVISPQFDYVGKFHAGAAPANENEKWGLIDTTGNWILFPYYDELKWMDSRSTPCWKVVLDHRAGLLTADPLSMKPTINQSQFEFKGWNIWDIGSGSLYFQFTNTSNQTDVGIYAMIVVREHIQVFPVDYRLAPHEVYFDHVETFDMVPYIPDNAPNFVENIPGVYTILKWFPSTAARDQFMDNIPWLQENDYDGHFDGLVWHGFLDPYEKGDQWLAENFDGAVRAYSPYDYRND